MSKPNASHVIGTYNVDPLPFLIGSVHSINYTAFQITTKIALHVLYFIFIEHRTAIALPTTLWECLLKFSAVATLMNSDIARIANHNIIINNAI